MWTFIRADTTVFNLEMGKQRFIMSEEGTGMPEIEYITQRGPFQHGETHLDYFLRPRVIQFQIRCWTSCFTEYWKERTRYLDALRPNLGEGTLRARLQDGTRRDIKAYIQQGPDFEKASERGWDEWSFTTTIRFICNDPTWFDPAIKTLTQDSFGGLVFPITFPITFDENIYQANVTYAGTWPSAPTITLTGPMSSVIITNVTTGKVIQFSHSIDVGETVTITLQYDNVSAGNNLGENLMPYLTAASNLTDFFIEPGVNTIKINALGTGAASQVQLSWYERYIGLGGVI